MYQQWVDNCTCFRLLSRAQKTAEDRSSDASINIYLLLPPSSVLLPQLQYSCFQNQRAFLLCARVWLAFWCFQKLHAEPRCLKSRKELPRKCMCVETPKRNHLKQMCAPVRQWRNVDAECACRSRVTVYKYCSLCLPRSSVTLSPTLKATFPNLTGRISCARALPPLSETPKRTSWNIMFREVEDSRKKTRCISRIIQNEKLKWLIWWVCCGLTTRRTNYDRNACSENSMSGVRKRCDDLPHKFQPCKGINTFWMCASCLFNYISKSHYQNKFDPWVCCLRCDLQLVRI